MVCITGPLWGESTGHRWIPPQWPVTRKAYPCNDVILMCDIEINVLPPYRWCMAPNGSPKTTNWMLQGKTIVTHSMLIHHHSCCNIHASIWWNIAMQVLTCFLMSKQYGERFIADISKLNLSNNNVWHYIKIWLKCVSEVLMMVCWTLVKLMAWFRQATVN